MAYRYIFMGNRSNMYIKIIRSRSRTRSRSCQGQGHRSKESVSVCRKSLQNEAGESWQSLSYVHSNVKEKVNVDLYSVSS